MPKASLPNATLSATVSASPVALVPAGITASIASIIPITPSPAIRPEEYNIPLSIFFLEQPFHLISYYFSYYPIYLL